MRARFTGIIAASTNEETARHGSLTGKPFHGLRGNSNRSRSPRSLRSFASGKEESRAPQMADPVNPVRRARCSHVPASLNRDSIDFVKYA